jgi:hypothetical protein
MEIHELIPDGPWDDGSGPQGEMTKDEKNETRLNQMDDAKRGDTTTEEWAEGWGTKFETLASKDNIFTRQMDFWYSAAHEAHLAEYYSRYDENEYRPMAVEIDKAIIPYTTCTEAGNPEPFKRALRLFPDYVKVATGTLRDFRHRGVTA